MAEQTSIGEVKPLNDVDWDSLAPGRNRLDVVIDERLRVYYKLDTTQYFVRATRWSGLTRTITMSDGHVSTAQVPGDAWSDHEICLLLLNLDQLDDIRRFGSCKSSVFDKGGLKKAMPRPSDVSTSVSEAQATIPPAAAWRTVDFLSCILVDKNRWSRPGHPTIPRDQTVTFENCAARVPVQLDDLYVETASAERIGREDVGYPPPDDARARPPAMVWLYKVAVAYNRGLVVPLGPDKSTTKTEDYEKIQEWLDKNAPKSIVRGALRKTAKTLAPQSYNRLSKFDEARLADIKGSDRVPKMHLSLAVRYALAMTEWWIDQEKNDGKQIRFELACRLSEANFGQEDITNLVAMITGKPVPRAELERFRSDLAKLLSGRRRRLVSTRAKLSLK